MAPAKKTTTKKTSTKKVEPEPVKETPVVELPVETPKLKKTDDAEFAELKDALKDAVDIIKGLNSKLSLLENVVQIARS